MDKAGHIFVGGALGIIFILLTHYYLNWFPFTLINVGIMIVMIYIYSLLADIDSKSATIVWTFIPISIVALVVGYLLHYNIFLIFGISLITITFLAAQFLPHRGFTHSLLFGILVSLPWIYLSWHYSILAFICFYSHMLADQEYFKIV
jgi:hypothetical protein